MGSKLLMTGNFLPQVSSGDFPHLLISGPAGAGKRTRTVCLLRELYGPGAERLRIEHQTFETPSKKKVEITTVASNYHIEASNIHELCLVAHLSA